MGNTEKGTKKNKFFAFISSAYYHFRKTYRDNGFVFACSGIFILYVAIKNLHTSYNWSILLLATVYTLYGLFNIFKFIAIPSFPKSYIRQCLENPKDTQIQYILLKEDKKNKNPQKSKYTLTFIRADGYKNFFSFRGEEAASLLFDYITSVFAKICDVEKISAKEFAEAKKQAKTEK